MIAPVIQARMEERHYMSAPPVLSLGAGLFVDVAPEATPAQIPRAVAAAALFWHDVINGEVVPSQFRA